MQHQQASWAIVERGCMASLWAGLSVLSEHSSMLLSNAALHWPLLTVAPANHVCCAVALWSLASWAYSCPSTRSVSAWGSCT